MSNSETIEIIVTTIAGYYGIEWQEIFRMRKQSNAPIRRNLVKLMAEHLELDHLQVKDHLEFDIMSIRRHMASANDFHSSRLSHEIRMQLATQQKRA